MAVLSELSGAVCEAEKRSRTAEQAPMFEHRDVRVRRGRRSASIAGKSRQHDVAETIASSAMVLATFAETKVARSPGRRAEKDMDVERQSAKSWIPGSALRAAPE